MRSPLATVVRAGSILFGLMWLWAAASKLAAPTDAYELTALWTRGDPPAKVVFAVWIGCEAGLGVAMLLGALRGFVATAAALAAMSWVLMHVRAEFGGHLRCGCLALLPDPGLDGALLRNVVLVAAALLLAVLARFTARRGPEGAPAETAAGPGPATPRP